MKREEIGVNGQLRPIFCVIYGADGIGKSTWVSKTPPILFIDSGIEGDAESADEAAAQ